MSNPIPALIPSNSTEYIKKSDVLQYIDSLWEWKDFIVKCFIHDIKYDISFLPTIDQIKTIDEMIEELDESQDKELNSSIWKVAIKSHIAILQELKQRLLSNNN